MKIEKDIPIPKIRSNSKYPFDRMEVGDSFLVEMESYSLSKHSSISSCAISWAIRNNKDAKFSCRRVKNGIRLWRIK